MSKVTLAPSWLRIREIRTPSGTGSTRLVSSSRERPRSSPDHRVRKLSAVELIAVEQVARCTAILENIDRDLSERGVTDKRGHSRSLLNHRSRISRELDRWLAQVAAAMERQAAAGAPKRAWRITRGPLRMRQPTLLGWDKRRRVGPARSRVSASVRWRCCVRRCGQRKADRPADRSLARISAARALAASRPQELEPVEETNPEPTLAARPTAGRITPATYRPLRRSGEDALDEERPSRRLSLTASAHRPNPQTLFLSTPPTATSQRPSAYWRLGRPRWPRARHRQAVVASPAPPTTHYREMADRRRPSFPPANTQEWPTNRRPLLHRSRAQSRGPDAPHPAALR